MADYTTLTELAQKIKDKTKQANALRLLQDMQTEIEGIGDRPVRWHPGFIRVVQATTDMSKVPDGATLGSLVWDNKAQKELRIIPLISYENRAMWDPDPNKNQMLCSSPDAKVGTQYGECRKCPFQVFDTEKNRSACSKQVTFQVLAPDFSNVGQVQFQKTSFMNGKNWITALRTLRTYPYTHSFNLVTEKSTKVKNVNLLKHDNAERVTYGEGEQEFVAELYRFFHHGREDFLKAFHEAKAERTALLASQTPAQLEHASAASEEEGTTLLTPPQEASVSDEAKKYDM